MDKNDGVHFNLSPVGGDTNRGGAPWAVSHRPQSVWPCDKLKCTQMMPNITTMLKLANGCCNLSV